MGCDIHLYVEKKVKNTWHFWDQVRYPTAGCNRNYERFAALAGVRGDGPAAKGLPEDVAEGTRLHHEEWSYDAHSATWYPLETACLIFANTDWLETPENRARRNEELNEPKGHICEWAYEYFQVDTEDIENYRIIMWFDN